MVGPLRTLRDTFHQVTHAQNSTAVDVVDNDAPPPLQPDLPTGLAPKSDYRRSIEKRHFFAQPPRGADGDGTICDPSYPEDDIRKSGSTFHALNREASTNGPGRSSPAFAGPFGLSEESLLRLEAGLRAQREQLVAQPVPRVTGPECPTEDCIADKAPEELAVPRRPAAPLAPELTSRLPRVAQLAPVPGITLPDNGGHVPFPAAIEPRYLEQGRVRRASSPPATAHARHLRFPRLFVVALMAVLLLLPSTVSMPDLELVHPEVLDPAPNASLQQRNASSIGGPQQVNILPSYNAAPPEIAPKLQATTTIPVSAQPEAPLEPAADLGRLTRARCPRGSLHLPKAVNRRGQTTVAAEPRHPAKDMEALGLGSSLVNAPNHSLTV